MRLQPTGATRPARLRWRWHATTILYDDNTEDELERVEDCKATKERGVALSAVTKAKQNKPSEKIKFDTRPQRGGVERATPAGR